MASEKEKQEARAKQREQREERWSRVFEYISRGVAGKAMKDLRKAQHKRDEYLDKN